MKRRRNDGAIAPAACPIVELNKMIGQALLVESRNRFPQFNVIVRTPSAYENRKAARVDQHRNLD